MAEAAYRSRHGHEGPGPADPSEWEAEHGHPAEQAEDGAMHGLWVAVKELNSSYHNGYTYIYIYMYL